VYFVYDLYINNNGRFSLLCASSTALQWEVPGFKRGPGYPHTHREHSQQGIVKDENHLGESKGGSSKQSRMASECGPMHCIHLNQGQGHADILWHEYL